MTTAPTELKPQPVAITPAMKERAAALLTSYGIKDGAYDLGHELLSNCLALATSDTRAPAVGGVRVKPLEWRGARLNPDLVRGYFGSRIEYYVTRGRGETRFQVKGPDTEYVGGFYTLEAAKAAAQAHHEAAILSALEPQAVDDAMVERMARAHDKEEAAQRGEPSPWDDPTIDAAWIAERITCMRAALQSAKEPSHD